MRINFFLALNGQVSKTQGIFDNGELFGGTVVIMNKMRHCMLA